MSVSSAAAPVTKDWLLATDVRPTMAPTATAARPEGPR